MISAKPFALIVCLTVIIGMLPAGAGALAQQTVQSRTVRPAGVSGELLDILNANDGKTDTRATSGKTDYVGMSVTIDAGGLQNIIGVKQDCGPWATHYPGAYKIEVAESLSGPWMTAFEGPGQRGESRAEFPAILARYVRITAIAKNTTYREDWSIAELKLGVDPGQTPRRIPARPERTPEAAPPATAARTLKDLAFATDKNSDTRASSGTPDYQGMSIIIDLGGEYELSRVVQLHGRWAEDYPAEYKIEVSRQRNESRFREAWRGPGKAGRSVARFEPVTTRYIRITALRNRDSNHWWSIAEVRTNRDPDVVEDEDDGRLARQIRSVTSRGFSNDAGVADDNNTTRSTTNKANYAGSWLQADLGGSYTVSKVVLFHEPDREDYPRRYKIDVSSDGGQWQTVFEGRGEPGRSGATFNPVRARFVRITAIAERDTQHWWSIYRLKISG
ncbi:MAG TPA: discoidin domain-containing protein [Blastocatellia bacterium]|nr:discoidin domain-containing protein [Blastocatellia bacterium]